MAAWIKMSLDMEVGLSPGDFLLDGYPAPLPKGGAEPLANFRPISIVAMHQDATWCEGRPQPRRLCVRLGPSYTPRKKAHPPPSQFLAHVYCDQTAGWIKMPLGTEINVGPGGVVLDGVAAPP